MYPISSNNFINNPYISNSYEQPHYWQGSYSQPCYYERQPEQANDVTKTVAMAGLLQVIALGLNKASQWFSNKLAAGKEFTTANNVRRVADDMVRKNNLDVHIGYINDANKYAYAQRYNLGGHIEEVARGKNAFFVDKLKLAVAPERKPSLILHELGHAINAKKPFTKSLQFIKHHTYFVPTALLLANGLFSNKNDGKKSFIERNAGILGFAAFLPTIAEEAIASLRGVKAAKKVLNNPASLNILKKNYLLALSTYILGGIGLGVASKMAVLEDSIHT